MSEFTEQFLEEGRELVEQATADLLHLEQRPSDKPTLENVFRAFHTLKGAAGIMEYAAMERLLHRAEDLLQAVRGGSRAVDPGLVDSLLGVLGQLLRWFDVISKTDAMPADADTEAERRMRTLGAVSAGATATQAAELSSVVGAILREQLVFIRLSTAGGRLEAARRTALNVLGASGADTSAVSAASGAEALAAAMETSLEAVSAAISEAAQDTGPTDAGAASIRVDVERLDAMVELVGELLVTKNAIGHLARMAREQGDAVATGLQADHERLSRQIDQLQSAVFDLRVVPVSRVFSRFPRLVRETAARLGKQVALRTEGDDTKADKAVVEGLFEPLLHVIRNAIDHGVEAAGARLQAGKPAEAQLSMRASRQGDRVVVEVSDDGRGIDPAAIRAAAVVRGVASEAAVEAMDDAAATNLVFASGFSTAGAVSDLSGRGVGMDAVRQAIRRMGGDVSLDNRPGRGLTVRLELPFSMMLTRVMTVSAGGQVFGVPLDAIVETVRVSRERIRRLGHGRAFVLRDRTIPVLNLAERLGLNPAAPSDDICVLVVWAAGEVVGLEIDRPGDQLDLMLKPVEGVLAGMKSVAGASVMGDGQVLIVVDLNAIAQ